MNSTRYESMLKTYRNAGLGGVIQDANPFRLTQLLLDGAASRLAVARSAMSAGDAARKGALIGNVMAILGQLRASLNFSAGGDLALRLDSLYEYMLRRLLESSSEGNLDKLDEVARLLAQISSAWNGIAGQQDSAQLPMAAVG